MRQLTGLDAAFLHLETATQFGHIAGLSIFTAPHAGYEPHAAWRAQVATRLPQLPPLRRRLAQVPLGIDHPYWVEDPDFDLDYHVRHAAVPPPGSYAQLSAVVARILARPLDRARPLWLSYVIEGLPDGQFAVLTVVHHATVDGASGVELLTLMLDREELPPPVAPDDAVTWKTERVPGDLELLGRASAGLVRKPGRALLLAAQTAREVGTATRNPVMVATARQVRRSLRGPVGAVLNLGRPRELSAVPPPQLPSLRPPRTPFNQPITTRRAVAIASAPLEDVKAIKRAFGVTLNDVVVAVVAGGLRRWLDAQDALPEEALVALVPVSVRTGEEDHRWTNRVSMLIAELPTDEPAPVVRVQRVHEAMKTSKGIFDAIPAERLTDFAEFPPPAVFARAMRISSRLRLGSRLSPGNLVISNVPGPREALYAAGARLEHYFPLSVLTEGQGLNVTVQSYRDTLDFGLIACPDIVEDLDGMLTYMLEEIDLLKGE